VQVVAVAGGSTPQTFAIPFAALNLTKKSMSKNVGITELNKKKKCFDLGSFLSRSH